MRLKIRMERERESRHTSNNTKCYLCLTNDHKKEREKYS